MTPLQVFVLYDFVLVQGAYQKGMTATVIHDAHWRSGPLVIISKNIENNWVWHNLLGMIWSCTRPDSQETTLLQNVHRHLESRVIVQYEVPSITWPTKGVETETPLENAQKTEGSVQIMSKGGVQGTTARAST